MGETGSVRRRKRRGRRRARYEKCGCRAVNGGWRRVRMCGFVELAMERGTL